MIHDGENLKQRPNGYKTQQKLDNGSPKESIPSPTGNVAKSTDPDTLKKDAGLIAAAAHAVVPTWANMVLMTSLIFGGCCANVSKQTMEISIWRTK